MSIPLHMAIGQLSKLSGVNIETIRYYEKQKLLTNPPRTAGGHRYYSGDHFKRLTFIRRSRQLDFSLAEIKELLLLVDDGGYTCGEIKMLSLEHTKKIQKKISDLQRMEKTLIEITSHCEDSSRPDCPIIDALSDVNVEN